MALQADAGEEVDRTERKFAREGCGILNRHGSRIRHIRPRDDREVAGSVGERVM